MNPYLYYLLIWFGLVAILFILFRYLPAKMKAIENVETRHSLFVILMFLGIPLILIIIIVPIIILIGDKEMAVKFKYLFILIALIVVLLFRIFQRKKDEKEIKKR